MERRDAEDEFVHQNSFKIIMPRWARNKPLSCRMAAI